MIEGGQESSDDEEEHLMLTYENPDDDSNSEEIDENSADGTNIVDDGDNADDHIRPGVELRIFKYKKKPKLNGTVVRVLKWSGEGIWEVELISHPMREIDSGSRLSIDQEYLIAFQ